MGYNKNNDGKIFLLCTGLGRIKRGFESYIEELGIKLSEQGFNVYVLGGRKPTNYQVNFAKLYSINRNSWLSKKLLTTAAAFSLEQLSAALFLFSSIITHRPKVIYLGEYQLYCYLFKMRKVFGFSYSLVLYTGGQAIPGLFDIQKDYVHHVTDVYVGSLLKSSYPADRQYLIPHFVSNTFLQDKNTMSQLPFTTDKKIVLSVGIVDYATKQMHLIPELLSYAKEQFFPVIIGETTSESELIKKRLTEVFGESGFYVAKVRKEDLAIFYQTADLFILLSPKESFGLVFVEAMCYGTNVICIDFPESRYVLKDKAFYLESGDIDSLRKQFQKVIELNPDIFRKSNENKRFVYENYSWESLANKYKMMFDEFAK